MLESTARRHVIDAEDWRDADLRDTRQASSSACSRQYRASGVEPPPPLFLTVSRAYDDKAEAPGADFTKAEAIDLPPGYMAYRGYAVAAFVRWGTIDGETIPATEPIVRINLGREDWVRHDGDPLTCSATIWVRCARQSG